MKYIVHNHEYNTESVLDQAQIEAVFPELRSGKLEIVDEIDTEYSSLKDTVYTELAVILETIQDIRDDNICKRLSDSVKVIDSALKLL